jgi:hypothetical protein
MLANNNRNAKLVDIRNRSVTSLSATEGYSYLHCLAVHPKNTVLVIVREEPFYVYRWLPDTSLEEERIYTRTCLHHVYRYLNHCSINKSKLFAIGSRACESTITFVTIIISHCNTRYFFGGKQLQMNPQAREAKELEIINKEISTFLRKVSSLTSEPDELGRISPQNMAKW